jgi:hypothetical protein
MSFISKVSRSLIILEDKHDQEMHFEIFLEKLSKDILNKNSFVMTESWISFENIHIFTVASDTTDKSPVTV